MITPTSAKAQKRTRDEAFGANPHSSAHGKSTSAGPIKTSESKTNVGKAADGLVERSAQRQPGLSPGTFTAVTEAIEHLRKNFPQAIEWDRVLANVTPKYLTDQNTPVIKKILLTPHDRVEIVQNDANGTVVRYKPLYPVTDADTLLEYFAERSLDEEVELIKIPLKHVKDGWQDTKQAKVTDILEAMEAEGKVLLLRTEGGKISHVVPDSPSYYVREKTSGQAVGVDDDLKKQWHGFQLPKLGADVDEDAVRKELLEAGLVSVVQDKELEPAGGLKKRPNKDRVTLSTNKRLAKSLLKQFPKR